MGLNTFTHQSIGNGNSVTFQNLPLNQVEQNNANSQVVGVPMQAPSVINQVLGPQQQIINNLSDSNSVATN